MMSAATEFMGLLDAFDDGDEFSFEFRVPDGLGIGATTMRRAFASEGHFNRLSNFPLFGFP
jgi:hypothetical protein